MLEAIKFFLNQVSYDNVTITAMGLVSQNILFSIAGIVIP
jgi:hypothetical protein